MGIDEAPTALTPPTTTDSKDVCAAALNMSIDGDYETGDLSPKTGCNAHGTRGGEVRPSVDDVQQEQNDGVLLLDEEASGISGVEMGSNNQQELCDAEIAEQLHHELNGGESRHETRSRSRARPSSWKNSVETHDDSNPGQGCSMKHNGVVELIDLSLIQHDGSQGVHQKTVTREMNSGSHADTAMLDIAKGDGWGVTPDDDPVQLQRERRRKTQEDTRMHQIQEDGEDTRIECGKNSQIARLRSGRASHGLAAMPSEQQQSVKKRTLHDREHRNKRRGPCLQRPLSPKGHSLEEAVDLVSDDDDDGERTAVTR